ncbi:MAG: hypothetical protein FJ115_00065 [Deltaproteobacteria bacterium]|nr:hypothetical protein [Deltaproteobacteria bacterium]MBM4321923.1 hypothetical protein [Deltaproteobacteria bacterium]
MATTKKYIKKTKNQNIPIVVDYRKRDEKFESINAAIDYFARRPRRNLPLMLGNCRFIEDGNNVKIEMGDDRYNFSSKGLEDLLGNLNVPESFIQYICPKNYVIPILNNLLEKKKKTKILCWIDETNQALEAITPPKALPIYHHAFLESYSQAFPEKDSLLEIRLIGYSLHLRRLSTFKEEPVPGDYFQFGIEFSNCDIYSPNSYPQVIAFLYRLICKNGSTIRSMLKNYSDAFRPPITLVEVRDRMRKITLDSTEVGLAINAIHWMAARQIGAHRKNIYNFIHRRLKNHLPMAEENPYSETSTYFHIFNDVTQMIQHPQVPGSVRCALESWAGSLIDAHIDSQVRHAPYVRWEDRLIPLN